MQQGWRAWAQREGCGQEERVAAAQAVAEEAEDAGSKEGTKEGHLESVESVWREAAKDVQLTTSLGGVLVRCAQLHAHATCVNPSGSKQQWRLCNSLCPTAVENAALLYTEQRQNRTN